MKSAVAPVVALLISTACSLTDSAQPVRAVPGQAFSLRVGESVRTDDGALMIGFVGVPTDSRCPKGEQCVWAGDATVQVWVQQAGGPRLMGDLHTASNALKPEKGPVLGLRLIRLDPHPIAGKVIAQGDYVATLSLDGGMSPEAPER